MRILFFNVLLFFFHIAEAQINPASLQQVNSSLDELNPVISPDGQTLYLTIANHPSNIGGKQDPGDIWFCKWTGESWAEPAHAGKEINNRSYNAVAGISPDGSEIFLLNHFSDAGIPLRTQGLAVAAKTEKGWSKPVNIIIPYFRNKSTYHCGTFSADMNVFIFSAETYGTLGVDDLYVTFSENGKWTEPKNLGPSLNTQFQEISPFLGGDGKTLYFSTNGRKGSGSFDIYSATRLDESWTNWSSPVNLGPVINTSGRELFYQDYPALGLILMTSTTNSDGYGDLRIHPNNEPVLSKGDSTIFAAVSNDPVRLSIKENDRPDVIRVYGQVINARTSEPVKATLLFSGSSLEKPAFSAATKEGYSLVVPSSGSYSVKIEAPGYVSAFEKIDIGSYENRGLELNFSLQPLEVGATVNLKSVLFVQTKTELLPESYDELNTIVSFLKNNPRVKIGLTGHTDNRGVHADNIRLSQQRVNEVKRYLVSNGIDPKRISGKGYGGTMPVASNESEETRKLNRRVEFTIRQF